MSTETADQAPAVSDLPSGDPINPPPPAPPSTASSKPRAPKLPLKLLLALSPTNVDSFVAHLTRCFATPSGIDVVLCFICYTSRFSASALDALYASSLRRSARRLVSLALSLPPDATILLSTAPPASAAATLASRAAGHLRALATLTSEARTIMRLWALLPMYLWLRRLMTAPKPTPEEKEKRDASGAAFDRALSWFQVTACILLQSLESSSYLASKGVLPMTPAQQGTAARWSVRFWSCFVGSELGRLLVEYLRRRKALQQGAVDVKSAEYRDSLDVWTRTLMRQASWFPLTVHWSMDKGFVPEMGIGFLGSIPGIVQMRQLWKETATA
ncbi:peroxin 11C [Colletotrichum karsti]|uniref:Peroxin 11C n=1 Tax=Colletotrichum karsti TaxID=1095194 RepID=A0A9P6I7X3_9PEZI|nr:peroxin 11C [Colletotrichum karsti]KAF9877387.1 peroxin 11C [Colletotrichum karsti]